MSVVTNKTYLFITNIKNLTPNLFKVFYSNLSAERKEKADKLKMQRDKDASVSAEILLKYGLKKLGIEYNELDYGYKQNKKPYLKGLSLPIEFNISHSGDYVICAISSNEVGCDIEKMNNINLNIGKRFFHKYEYKHILEQNTIERQKDLLYRYWTLKESFVKAVGCGIYNSLNKFCIIIGSKVGIEQDYTANIFYFTEPHIDAKYKCAVCSLDKNIEIINVDIKDMI